MSPLTLGTRIAARSPSRTILVESRDKSGQEEFRWSLEPASKRGTGRIEQIPRFTGSILGVRQWLVPRSMAELKPLGSLKSNLPSWEIDGSASRARCLKVENKLHEIPGKNCECGLRAYHPWFVPPWYLRSGDKAANQDLYLTGVVEAWGRIELYAESFRAEFARPVALVLPPAFTTNDIARTALGKLCSRADAEMLDPGQPGSLGEQLPQRGDNDADQQLTRIVLEAWLERNRPTTDRDILANLTPSP